jgi:hypothetical protein
MLSSVVIIGQGTLECKVARNPYTILVLEETPGEMWAYMCGSRILKWILENEIVAQDWVQRPALL